MPKKTRKGTVGIFQHPFCRKTAKKLKGGPFWIFKHPFYGKISNKLKGDPLEFLTSIPSQNIKKLKGENFIFGKKSQCRKKLEREPLGFFNIHSVAKQQKN